MMSSMKKQRTKKQHSSHNIKSIRHEHKVSGKMCRCGKPVKPGNYFFCADCERKAGEIYYIY